VGASAEEKGKIDSKVGTANNDDDKYNEVLRPNAMFFDMTVSGFVKFKVHEYNQSHHEKASYVDIPIWQMIHDHFFTFQDDHLQYVRDFIIANATISDGCKISFVPISDQSRVRNVRKIC